MREKWVVTEQEQADLNWLFREKRVGTSVRGIKSTGDWWREPCQAGLAFANVSFALCRQLKCAAFTSVAHISDIKLLPGSNDCLLQEEARCSTHLVLLLCLYFWSLWCWFKWNLLLLCDHNASCSVELIDKCLFGQCYNRITFYGLSFACCILSYFPKAGILLKCLCSIAAEYLNPIIPTWNDQTKGWNLSPSSLPLLK